MPIRKAVPYHFSPVGASDALDSTNIFKGAMGSLQNLIPDVTTKNLWQCRPASISKTTFGTFTTPGFISAFKIVGTRAYGMIASGRNPGFDEPFCFDLPTQTFQVVTGITGANVPVSPASSGTWTPPIMDLIGVRLVVTHPGFTGGGGMFFGWFDISDPANITWSAGNTAPTALAAPPIAVAQFGGRAWFLVNPPTGNPAAYFSDVLLATTITLGTQILTFNDNTPLTAAAGLPLTSQLGGIIQSLIVFKGVSNIYQITGDAATNNLSMNSLNVATGTLSPLSVCTTPKGLAFIAPDGLRIIDFQARVSDPIGNSGDGVATPFVYSVIPSRVAAACNTNIIRVQVQNGFATGSPSQEWWLHLSRGVWSGPHTFASSLIQPYSNTFIKTAIGVDAKLFQSDPVQSVTSTYVENGTQMTFAWQTSMMPDPEQMAEFALGETTINMALAPSITVSVSAGDQEGALYDTVAVVATGTPTIWGAFTWGQALWQGAANALYPRPINWAIPIVFRRLFLGATGSCASGVKIGDAFLRLQKLGYLQQGG